jgi:hypothetical protein
MKSNLTFSLILLVFLMLQACGSVPQQTVSHIGNSGDRFDSGTFGQPFDRQSELTSTIGFNQPESVPELAGESGFEEQNKSDIGIIFMPVTIQTGLPITWRMLRLCETLYKNPCTHLRVQAGQPGRFPNAPVSLPEESGGTPAN